MTQLTVPLTLSLLVVFLALRTPIAFALGLAGACGIFMLRGLPVALNTVASLSYSLVATQTMAIIPLFILMGGFAFQARLAADMYELLNRALGGFRSSVAIATVLAGVGFAAVTGSSVATVAALARSSIVQMERFGFATRFASGIVATVGTLGILIPPSIALALYGIVSGESISQLLIAGIIPGLISATGYILAIIIVGRLFPSFAYSSPRRQDADDDVEERTPISSLMVSLAMTGTIFLIVIGGIMFGFYTATESAAIGALAAGLMLFFRYARTPRVAAWRAFEATREATSTMGMLFALIIGAGIFTSFLVSAGVLNSLSSMIIDSGLSGTAILLMFVALMIVMGCFLEGSSIILVVVPLMHPVLVDLGYDGIWLGIVVVKMIEIGLITPPLGLNAFVVSGTMQRISPGEVFRGITPFYVVEIVILAVLILFPEVVTILPSIMRG